MIQVLSILLGVILYISAPTFTYASDIPGFPEEVLPVQELSQKEQPKPLCEEVLSKVETSASNEQSISTESDLYKDFTEAREEVLKILETKALVLKMPKHTKKQLLEMVDLPENRKFFDPALSLAVYGIDSKNVTYDLTAFALLQKFIEHESSLIKEKPWKKALQYSLKGTKWFGLWLGSLFTFSVISAFLQAPIAQISTPWSEPISYKMRTESFRRSQVANGYPQNFDPEQERFVKIYEGIWRRVNEKIALNEREGRSYLSHTLNPSINIVSEYVLLLVERPAKDALEYDSWLATVIFLRKTLASLPKMFPDVYEDPDFGKELLEFQERLLKDPKVLKLISESQQQ